MTEGVEARDASYSGLSRASDGAAGGGSRRTGYRRSSHFVKGCLKSEEALIFPAEWSSLSGSDQVHTWSIT